MKILKGLKEMYQKMNWYNRQKLREVNPKQSGGSLWSLVVSWFSRIFK
jgi:hypothetical protein